jgi:glycosyltransferase involved in cell wall biosynthesis
VRELAARLNDPPNVEIEVACLKGWGPVADQLRDAKIPVTALELTRAWQFPAGVRRLRELVRERKIDTIVSFLIHANALAAIAVQELPGVRLFQSVQTIQPRPRWHWLLQSRIERAAEKLLVPSTAVAKFVTQRCGVAEDRFVVIPNAVDPAAYPRVEVFARPRLRAGYLGRLDPNKSPWTLLNAIAFVDDPDGELHYFGDGPARAELERAVRRSGLEGRVHFHGVVARPQLALAEMDILWSPSTVEGFGLVLIEAMASGVPVVAEDAGGSRDIVQDGENGFLAHNYYHRFAAALYEMRSKTELREKIIENGLRTVREKFSWEVVLPQYRQLLNL